MRAFLLLALAAGCNEYNLDGRTDDYGLPEACDIEEVVPADVVPVETCETDPGGFEPIVEWTAGAGKSARSTVAVADLDGDGLPEVVGNFTGNLPGASKGDLVALHGDGSPMWSKPAQLAYASSPAVGDVDGDGSPEVLGVKALGSQMPTSPGTYSVVCYDAEGTFLWESDSYPAEDFDYATGLVLADLDADGETEIVAGRVILHADGSHRGTGTAGRGSWGEMPGIPGGPSSVSEATVPAVADLDLDGQKEVIVGNARYDADGFPIWLDLTADDGMVGVANLDDDPEGEVVVSSFDTVRAVDTDGTTLWGPLRIEGANIVSPPGIADIDHDGEPEIVVAGGNQIVALNADGSTLWTNAVTDMSGATGASFFDFEGDSIVDVVYIDEIEMVAFDGLTGEVKFLSDEHHSETMMDYPVIADVDADGHAEIVVAHGGYTHAISVYGDAGDSWAPARPLWNQHAYHITNIADDLSIPADAPPGFTTHNTWHSAIDPRILTEGLKELSAEIVATCDLDCERGTFYLLGRVENRSENEMPAGIDVALYAVSGGTRTLLEVRTTSEPIPSGTTGEVLTFEVDATLVQGADAVDLVADDEGSGIGQYLECDEDDNAASLAGPLCE